jgi:hypothetical protein
VHVKFNLYDEWSIVNVVVPVIVILAAILKKIKSRTSQLHSFVSSTSNSSKNGMLQKLIW